MKNANTEEVLLSQLYDIYDPLPVGWWQNPWYYAALIMVALIIVGGWWIYVRTRKPPRPLTYWEQALYDLRQLEQQVPVYEPAQLYQHLTDIFKSYAQIRFNQPLVDKTDYELMAKLPSLSADGITLLPQQIAALKLLFEQGPLIKFAKQRVPDEQRIADILLVRDFIQLTRPHPENEHQTQVGQTAGNGKIRN